MRYLMLVAFIAGAAAAAACGNPTGLFVSHLNAVDTVSLYALSGTAVNRPSGFSMVQGAPGPVRTDQSASFDFAFDIDTAGRAVLLPLGALKLAVAGVPSSGILLSTQPFDSIKIAPTTGYQLDSAVVVHDSTVALVHSSQIGPCGNGEFTFFYAKLHVLAIDTTSTPNGRRIDFEILGNYNCGYRSLEPGTPKN